MLVEMWVRFLQAEPIQKDFPPSYNGRMSVLQAGDVGSIPAGGSKLTEVRHGSNNFIHRR